jgi:hypothetical protein
MQKKKKKSINKKLLCERMLWKRKKKKTQTISTANKKRKRKRKELMQQGDERWCRPPYLAVDAALAVVQHDAVARPAAHAEQSPLLPRVPARGVRLELHPPPHTARPLLRLGGRDGL